MAPTPSYTTYVSRGQPTNVVVEYDGLAPGSRLRREFPTATAARRYYAKQVAAGRNPKVVSAVR